MVKPTPKQLKNIVFIAILIVFLAMFSFKGYEYIKKEKETLKNDITKLEDEKKILQDSIIYYKNIDNELEVVENNYYYDYIREYNKRIKAEKALKNIRYLVFDREYLDSIAKYIRFN